MTPTPTTRDSLLFRLRDSQDHKAWVEFVEIYEPVIDRQLRKCGLQDADARELMQEFFITVSRRIEHWELAKERGSFRGWLRRVNERSSRLAADRVTQGFPEELTRRLGNLLVGGVVGPHQK